MFKENIRYYMIKDAFRGFSPCPNPFLECQRFVNLAVYFIRTRSSLILNCSSGPFLLYYTACWSGGEKKRIMSGGEEGNWSVFNNWKNGLPYFIYVAAIISI